MALAVSATSTVAIRHASAEMRSTFLGRPESACFNSFMSRLELGLSSYETPRQPLPWSHRSTMKCLDSTLRCT